MKLKKFVLFTTLLTIISCNDKKAENNVVVKTPKVEVIEIASNTENEALKYSGTIEADNTVSVGFMASGRVNNVLVQEGDKVQKGQLLATIDPTSYKNAFDIANAGLELANDNYNRLEELYNKGSLPERDFIQIKVGLAQAKANKNIAEKNLSDTKLYAPFTGMITAKSTEIGGLASPGVPAFTIMKTDKVYAKASISESEISKLKIGADATIEIPSLNKSVVGKVTIVNLSADVATRTFNVKVRLENPYNELLPGMISNIKIVTNNTKNIVTIPAKVVVRDINNITYAFVVENNKAIKKRVSLGNFKGNEVIVLDGIYNGDKVITKGYTNIKDGQTVSF